MPKCPWHCVKHIMGMFCFGMKLWLHCEPDPLTKLACPLDSLFPLTSVS